MTVNVRSWSLVAALTVALAAPAAAQNDRPPGGERGTELDGMVGTASTDAHTGVALAAIAGWRLAGWVRAEARAAWLDRGRGADGFGADVGGAFRPTWGFAATPYVGAGFGLYRASFEATTSPMSPFYRRRFTGTPSVAAGTQTFTDPAFRVSAGLDWRVGRAVSVRPEVSAVFVRRDGRGETLGLFGLRIGYRFEDRPVTPARRPGVR